MSANADTIRRLGALGLTTEQIAGVVEIMDGADEARRAAKRAGNRERQASYRQRNADNALSRVTERDDTAITRDPSPKERKVSPDPSKETQPSPETPSTADAVSAPPPVRRDDLLVALEAYNAAAGRQGWPEAQKLTSARQASLRKRLADAGGLAGWVAAMDRAERSEFLTAGRNGWRPGLDFFLQASSFQKLLEGSYDDRQRSHNGFASGPPRRPSGASQRIAGMAEALRELSGGDPPAEDVGEGGVDRNPAPRGAGNLLPFEGRLAAGFR